MIDYIMKRSEGNHGFTTVPRRSSRYPKEVVNDLDFADDIALLENSFEQAQAQLNTVAEEASRIGLVINTQKTEFMTNTSCKKNLTLNNADIKLVDDFTYLGSKMASSESDIKRRLGLAWSIFWKLERLWRSKSVPTNLKVNLFKATCLSILLYGCEGWTLTKKLEDKLNSYATSCYRIMLGIKRLDFISNEEVLRQVQQEKLIQLIQQRQLRFLGHILRKPEDELANKYALYHPRHGKRKVGRPKTLFHQYIARVICQGNPPTPEEIRLMAQDRTNWGKFVADCAAVG